MKKPATRQIFPLQASVQHYAWGGTHFIPDLLNIDNLKRQPYAELWLGTHPRGPAKALLDGDTIPLDQIISRDPKTYLGEAVVRNFDGQLPFLFKVLDVHKMLSIQAHPTKHDALIGYRLENERGVPLDVPHRVFKDDNHKPEVMVALSDFWLLHGFRAPEKIAATLRQFEAWKTLRSTFADKGIAALYRHIMELPQKEVNRLLDPLAKRLLLKKNEGIISKDQPEYWAASAFEDYTSTQGDYDRGIFSIFLFNLVHLKPGEGIFQDAGIPHAYLEGVNMELMANSDNVFRGGLTQKHVDVAALMKHLIFEPVTPTVIKGKPLSDTELLYPTSAPDFQLSRIKVSPGTPHQAAAVSSPQILLVLDGNVKINEEPCFAKGQSFYVIPETAFQISSEREALLFKASVPAGEQS